MIVAWPLFKPAKAQGSKGNGAIPPDIPPRNRHGDIVHSVRRVLCIVGNLGDGQGPGIRLGVVAAYTALLQRTFRPGRSQNPLGHGDSFCVAPSVHRSIVSGSEYLGQRTKRQGQNAQRDEDFQQRKTLPGIPSFIYSLSHLPHHPPILPVDFLLGLYPLHARRTMNCPRRTLRGETTNAETKPLPPFQLTRNLSESWDPIKLFTGMVNTDNKINEPGKLSHFLSWWKYELVSMFQTGSNASCRADRTVLLAQNGGDVTISWRGRTDRRALGTVPLSTLEPSALGAIVEQIPEENPKFGLCINDSCVLRRDLTFPFTAEKHLSDVISHRIDRITPYSEKQVAFAYSVTNRTAADRSIDVTLSIVPIENFQPLLKKANDWGFPISFLLTSGRGKDEDTIINLAQDSRPAGNRSIASSMTAALLAINVLLAGLILGLKYKAGNDHIEELNAQLNSAQQMAAITTKTRQKIAQVVKEKSFLAVTRRDTPFAVDVVNEITRIVPDGVWLEKLSIKKGQVQLHGQAPAAAKLIAIIEASEKFSGAQFRAPVTQGSEGDLERFVISAALTGAQR